MSASKNIGTSRVGRIVSDSPVHHIQGSLGECRSAGGTRSRRVRVAVAWVAAVAALLAGAAGDAQTVSVGEGGTPSYGIAIAVPPGIGGMQPNIGLAYTGSPVNGPVGYGWTITGISTISRCAYTRAIDGYMHGVDYGPNDKLCLDGERLIQTDANGTPVNAANTAPTPSNPFQQSDSLGFSTDTSMREYRTEKNQFARIRAYGAAGGNVANGPAYFTVWTKSGQIYEYGTHSNSSANATILPNGKTAPAAWAASRISDTLGNFIDFQYTQRDLVTGSGPTTGAVPGHEWSLAEIRYTGHGAQQPLNKVVFEYTDRAAAPQADRSEAYQVGSKNVSVTRLNAVSTWINWPGNQVAQPAGAIKVRSVKIAYDSGAAAQRSRVHTITECVGPSGTKCLPPTTFNYAAGGTDQYQANAAFASSSLSTTQLQNQSGTLGVILGDFNGDGRTDLIRWSDTPSLNQLWTSNGDGTFTRSSTFNITGDNLYKSDGCYAAYAMDMNGDGLVDILRVHQTTSLGGASCGAGSNYIYLSNGNGTFTQTTVPSNISLAQVTSVNSTNSYCGPPMGSNPTPAVSKPVTDFIPGGGTSGCSNGYQEHYAYGRSQGANFHVLDVNGDGLPDIVTTIVAAVTPVYDDPPPTPDQGCDGAPTACTHVYLRNASGSYVEMTTSNVAHHSLYGPPGPTPRMPNIWLRPYVVDVDGDGLADILVATGTWHSMGDGNFTTEGASGYGCANPLDFNGDGRADCLYVFPSTTPWLTIADGATNNVSAGAFNLGATGSGNELVGTGIGTVQVDVNGDGRTDIIRWEDNPAYNKLYLSNGDGSFTASGTFKFNAGGTPIQLKKSDGSSDFVVGDFTGHGASEILRLVATIGTGESGTNQLYTKVDSTPPDQLQSVVGPSGLRTDLTWVSMANPVSGTLGARYASDRGTANAAVAPFFDLTVPSYVVATSTTDSGVGSARVATDYWYAGLKGNFDGRGVRGFRETRRQSPGSNGNLLTIDTQYLVVHPYVGVAAMTETWSGALNQSSPVRLARTTNVYCEQSVAANATSATSTSPCATTAKVQAPFLYSTLEEGWELGSGTVLPTIKTVSSYNSDGDPLSIVATTSGTALGIAQQFQRTTTNTYYPDSTSGNIWILGRLASTSQQNTVPNSLPSISTSAGNGKFASATKGGVVDASLSSPSFASTTVGTSTTANATLTNTGAGVVNITTPPSASSVTGTDFSFVSTSCGTALAVGASCVITVKFAPTAAVVRTGQVTVQTDVGARSASLSATGVAAPNLTLQGCFSMGGTTPSGAVFTCTLGNTGGSAATSVTYTASGMSASGPSSCPVSSNCGAVSFTTPGTPGTYSGTLVATPNLGTAASVGFSLTVNSNAQLTLTSCVTSAFTTTPTQATFSCFVGNSGQTAVASISYASSAGTTVVGPTACAANTTNCGSATVTTSTAPGTYAGTLTATPANGAGASTGYSLTVLGQAALTLTSCSGGNTATPTPATYRCTLGNVGQSAGTGIVYSAGSGASASGPTTCSGNNANCGQVVLTTGTSPATYAGTLSATPTSGAGASVTYSLTVNNALLFTVGSPSIVPGNQTRITYVYTNPNSTPQPVLSVSYGADTGGEIVTTGGTCPGATVAAGATCTLVLTAIQDCFAYSVYGVLTTAAGTTTGNWATVPKPTGSCNAHGPFGDAVGDKPATGASSPVATGQR